MLDGAKEKMVERALSDVRLSETDQGQAIRTIIRAVEMELSQSVSELLDAVDAADDVALDPDHREEVIEDTLDALLDDSLPVVAAREMGSPNPEKVARYAGLEDWQAQREAWYSRYHSSGVVETPLDEATAEEINGVVDAHCQQVFGLDSETFRTRIVDWDRGEELQRLLVGPTLELAEVVDRVADEIEEETDES